MSGVINLNNSALYGFIQEWGYNAFNSSILVGEYQDQKFGVFPQYYTYQGGKNNSQTFNGTVWPYSYIGYTTGPQSSLDGGPQQGGLTLTSGEWSDGAQTYPGNILYPNNWQPYYNLYTLLSPISNNLSATITVTPSYATTVPVPPQVAQPGQTYEGDNQQFVSFGNPTFTVISNVSDSDVVYNTSPAGAQPIQIQDGNLTGSIADTINVSVQFTFIPGNQSQFNLSHNFTQTITSNNTQGTSQSGSTSGSNTATLGYTNSTTVNVGLDKEDGVSDELQESYSDAWQTAWSNTSSANFSTTNAISSNSSFSFATTENLGDAIQTGTQKTTNGNVTPLYQYTTTYTDPSTGQPTTTTFDLIAGGVYQWNLQFYTGDIQNNVTGQYSISGNTGAIEDQIGNTFGGNIAQAYYWANWGNAWDTLGYNYNPVVSFNGIAPADIQDPSQITNVLMNGGTVGSTNLATQISLELSAVSSVSSNTSGTSSSSSLMQPTGDSGRTELGKRKWTNIIDGLLVRPEDTRNSSAYYGDDSASNVRDTLGQDYIRTAGGRDFVLIRGNSVQAGNDGDIANLGSGSDIVDARKAVGTNTVSMETGNDLIYDGSSNLSADLGDGNDRYIYGGGNDFIKLGDGFDNLNLKRGKGSVVVHDFEAGEDTIIGLKKGSRLVWNDDLSGFTIENSDRVTGKLYTTGSTTAQDPDFWYGLGLQNSESLRLKANTNTLNSWRDIRSQYGRYGFSQADLQTKDWSVFSQNRKDVAEAAHFIADSNGVSNLSKQDLREINKLAGFSDSFYGFIAATSSYLTNN